MVISSIIDFILHIDVHLGEYILQYGIVVYGLLFMIIFLETGLVIAPLLPGDSLLFAAGAFAALGSLNLFLLLIIMSIAAILGDSLNYWLGHKLGRRVFTKENSFLFNKEYLTSTEKFYERHGGKTVILARFIPIIRTFAPFVAGMGSMSYMKFLSYNVIGGIAWSFLFILAGFFFGGIPLVKHNFSLVIMGIILISILPLVIKGVLQFIKRKHSPHA